MPHAPHATYPKQDNGLINHIALTQCQLNFVYHVWTTEMHVSRSAFLFAKAQTSLPRECQQVLRESMLQQTTRMGHGATDCVLQ